MVHRRPGQYEIGIRWVRLEPQPPQPCVEFRALFLDKFDAPTDEPLVFDRGYGCFLAEHVQGIRYLHAVHHAGDLEVGYGVPYPQPCHGICFGERSDHYEVFELFDPADHRVFAVFAVGLVHHDHAVESGKDLFEVFLPERVSRRVIGRRHYGHFRSGLQESVDVQLEVFGQVDLDRPSSVHLHEEVVKYIGGHGHGAAVPVFRERLESDVYHLVGTVSCHEVLPLKAVKVRQSIAEVVRVGVRISVDVAFPSGKELHGGRVGPKDVHVGVQPDLVPDLRVIIFLEPSGSTPHNVPGHHHSTSLSIERVSIPVAPIFLRLFMASYSCE